MHFFTEQNKLQDQTPENSYGPISEMEYRTTSKFTSPIPLKAFAVVDGLLIVQPVVGSKVNIIIKPLKPLEIDFTSVKYFVYRGLNINSFFSGSEIIPEDVDSNSDLIKNLWVKWNELGLTGNPTAKLLGYGTPTNLDDRIDDIFADLLEDIKPFPVLEGDWIGNFLEQSIGYEIGFEIVLEEGDVVYDYNYARKTENIIDVTVLTDFDLKMEKEKILNFIDPAAFFGLYYNYGLKVYNSDSLFKDNELYSQVISKFYTKNKLYLDIRNDIGYSYNLYDNYKYGADYNLSLGNSETDIINVDYETTGWPILIIDRSMDHDEPFNNIKLKLPLLYNNNSPILYIHNPSAIKPTRFINMMYIYDDIIDTHIISFYFPNIEIDSSTKRNVAWYIKLHYFRDFNSANVLPDSILKTENYTDNIFGPIDTPRLGNKNDPSKFLYNQGIKYISGTLKDDTDEFGFFAETGVSFEDDDDIEGNDKVVFFARSFLSNKITSKFKDKVYDKEYGLSLNNSFFEISFLNENLRLGYEKIVDPDTGEDILLIQLNDANLARKNTENLLLLCLNQNEKESLEDESKNEFNTNHNRYFKLEYFDSDVFFVTNGFYRYKVGIQGINKTTFNNHVVFPITPIYVYTKDGLVFSTKSFASSVPFPAIYTRNLEEERGAKSFVSHSADYDSTTKKITITSDLNSKEYIIGNIICIKYNSNLVENYTITNIQIIGSETIITVEDIDIQSFTNGKIYLTNENHFIFKDNAGTLTESDGTVISEKAQDIVNTYIEQLNTIPNDNTSADALRNLVEEYATKIISRVRAFTYNGGAMDNADDRILYWARIKMQVALKSHPFLLQSTNHKVELIKTFENLSRNYTNIDFSKAPSGAKKVLLTGFDPFFLDSLPAQSNPSGAAALSLHGQTLTIDDGVIYIQTAIFPVRYKDFDEGKVEDFFTKYIDPSDGAYQEVDLIMTLSQGGPDQFWVDRFAARIRGGGKDNLNIVSTKFPEFPKGGQFYETTLDETKIVPLSHTGEEYRIYYNNNFKYSYSILGITNEVNFQQDDNFFIYKFDSMGSVVIDVKNFDLEFSEGHERIENLTHIQNIFWKTDPVFRILPGYVNPDYDIKWEFDYTPNQLTDTTTPKKSDITAKKGSGGDYLSNEIHYRVSRLRTLTNGTLQTGHYHVPLIQSKNYLDYIDKGYPKIKKTFEKDRTQRMIDVIKQSIKNIFLIFLLFFAVNTIAQPINPCNNEHLYILDSNETRIQFEQKNGVIQSKDSVYQIFCNKCFDHRDINITSNEKIVVVKNKKDTMSLWFNKIESEFCGFEYRYIAKVFTQFKKGHYVVAQNPKNSLYPNAYYSNSYNGNTISDDFYYIDNFFFRGNNLCLSSDNLIENTVYNYNKYNMFVYVIRDSVELVNSCENCRSINLYDNCDLSEQIILVLENTNRNQTMVINNPLFSNFYFSKGVYMGVKNYNEYIFSMHYRFYTIINLKHLFE